MPWNLLHIMRYDYGGPTTLGPQEVRLRPTALVAGQLTHYQLQLFPPPPQVGHWRQDFWNNWVYQAWYPGPVASLSVINRIGYRPQAYNPFGFVVEQQALERAPEPDQNQSAEMGPFLQTCLAARNWVQPWLDFGSTSLERIAELNREVNRQIAYEAREAPGVQSPEETLQRARGSCRDLAWLLTCSIRALGHPARFVSGYWLQTESMSAELHAWTECYLPGAGWIGLDPTAGMLVGSSYLPTARAPRPEGAAALIGSHSSLQWSCQFRIRLRKSS